MGWQDAPVVEVAPAWASAPEVTPARPAASRPAPESPNWLEQQLAKLPDLLSPKTESRLREMAGPRVTDDAQLAKLPDLLSPKTESRLRGIAMGAADPSVGAAQLAAHLVGVGKPVDEAVAAKEAEYQAGRAGAGRDGVDLARVTGNIASPATLLPLTRLAPAATLGAKVAQGAKVGTALGLTAPVTDGGDEFWTDKAGQGVSGAAVGTALPLAAGAVGAAGRLARDVTGPLRESWRTGQGQRYMKEMLGPGRQAVADAILNRGNGPMTAADAVAAANVGQVDKFGSPLVAIEDQLARQPGGISDAAKAVWARQETGRQAALAAVKPDLEAAVAARSDTTGPMREAELAAANTAGIKGRELADRLAAKQESLVSAVQDAGRTATEAAQQEVLANGGRSVRGNVSPSAYPAPGQPRIPGRYTLNADRAAEFQDATSDIGAVAAQRRAEKGLAEYQLGSIEAHGLKPLQSAGVLQSIDATLSRPGTRASDVVRRSLGWARDKLASLTDEQGVIDARDLYTVRKEIGNVVTQLSKETGNWDQKLTSGVQRDVQAAIDAAIERAGGTGWKDYLAKYQEMSGPVNQAKVIQAMQDVLTGQGGPERVTPFLNVLGRGEQALLKKSTGFPRYESGDLPSVLTGPGQMDAVNRVSAELTRDLERKALGQSVDVGHLFNIADKGKGAVVLPNLLSRPAMAMNFVMRNLGHGADEKITQDMGRLMIQDPSAFAAKYLTDVPPSQRAVVMQQLSDLARRGALSAGAQAAGRAQGDSK